MASKIRILPDSVINQIAAGEVIANPASVVKELIENALDAGATEITVETKAGGRSLIRISDDGCGMNKDDALLCLERYGTSKLRSFDDLQSLASMGFRGEAVPSIAAISKLTLITSTTLSEGKEEGSMLIVEGGKVLKCASAVRSPGTTFEVKSLFFNVPVRKKFLKSPAHDSAEILRVVSVLALANPKIKFQLIDDQKDVLSCSIGNDDGIIDRRIQDVLGENFLEALIPLDHSEGDYHLTGRIGIPTFTRQNRSGQFLFINGRAVVVPLISQAVRDSYGTAIPSQRYPVFILYLKMPPTLLDVNVHPQKKEVRICEEALVKNIITQAVMNALQQKVPESVSPLPQQSNSFSSFVCRHPMEKFDVKPAFSLDKIVENSGNREQQVDWILPSPPLQEKEEAPLLPSFQMQASYRVVATIPGYFFAEKGEEALFLIDQRRAHHRILFENFKTQIDSGKAAKNVRQLLIPHTLELSKSESALMRQWLDTLNSVGISIREFGDTTFLIDSIPDTFKHRDMAKLLEDILDDLQEFQLSHSLKQIQEKHLIQLASRVCLDYNTRLSFYEAQSLMDQLLQCQSPQQCPLGKPITVQIQRESISKILN